MLQRVKVYWRKRNQRGAALITAILITALAAMIATRLAWQSQHLINQRELASRQQQTLDVLLAARNLMAAKLIVYANSQPDHITIYKLTKKMQYDSVKILDTQVDSTLYDALGRFNVNHVSRANYPNFGNMLSQISDSSDVQRNRKLALSVAKWISPIPDAAFDMDYQQHKSGYLPPHQPIIDSSSLYMLFGFSQKLLAKLRPNLIALPETRLSVNVNSVRNPKILLACGFNNQQIQQIASCQNQIVTGAGDLQRCMGLQQAGNFDVGYSSEYFILTSCAKVSSVDEPKCLQSLLYLHPEANQIQVSVLWQRMNATMLPVRARQI